MKYAVGTVLTCNADTLKRPQVSVRGGGVFLLVPEELAKEEYPRAVLVRYDPDDQVAHIVTMEEVQDAFAERHLLSALRLQAGRVDPSTFRA